MILNFVHFLSFSLAIGGGAAVLVLMSRMARDPDAAPHLRPAIWVIASVGMGAIGFLWLTGMAMWVARHDASMDLGMSWHVKLAAVLVLTTLAALSWRRMAVRRPLPLKTARVVLILQLAAALVAVWAAVVTFVG